MLGGSLGDRFGRKFVIWFSILGVLPFTLALPYANLFWTGVLTVPIGMILASAFPAIVVYGQELVPFKVGTVAGLFFGLAFGLGGVGAALLGQLADVTGIEFVFSVCSFLPAIGLLAAFLPHTAGRSARARQRLTLHGFRVFRRRILEERIAEVVLEVEQELVVLLADVFRELGSFEPRDVPRDRPRLASRRRGR